MSTNTRRDSLENMPTRVHRNEEILNNNCGGGLSNWQFEKLLECLGCQTTDECECTSDILSIETKKTAVINDATNLTNTLTSGPFILPQKGMLSVTMLNNGTVSNSTLLKVWNLSDAPKTLLKIGEVKFKRKLNIAPNTTATAEFDITIPANARLQIEIKSTGNIYPAAYLSTQPDLSLQSLLRSGDFVGY